MLDFHSDKYDQYKFEYDQFVKSKTCPRYSALSDGVNYDSEVAYVMKYSSLNSRSDNVFLIVPSIFNSPEILFLSGKDNFVQNLRKKGEVYLVNWKESSKQLKIEDLVQELQKIISFIGKRINLIGHCLGGNICIAVASIENSKISSLSLLTTPWDFSHFGNFTLIQESFGLQQIVKEIDLIPKIYVQIMFFLMFPSQYNNKINKYFDLCPNSKELFLRVEDWLQSGIAIPKSLYLQIIKEFCSDNITLGEEWIIDGSVVNLGKINVPTCIIYAREDQIVPYSSIVPLQKQIKTSTVIEVDGGHIGYLINANSDFQKKYDCWLRAAL